MKGSDPMKPAEDTLHKACVKVAGKWDSDFPPEPSIGDIEMPKAQEPPEEVKGLSNQHELKPNDVKKKLRKCQDFRIPEDLDKDAKWQDRR